MQPGRSAHHATDHPLRVVLFTDTLGDINGVSRFIRNVAEQALQSGRTVRVLTSTRFAIPDAPNLINIPPLAAMPMPGYPNLELALPRARELSAKACSQQPDVIHVSTPGPVGLIGVRTAMSLGIPIAGVYHTDFPAYMQRLFGDDVLARACEAYMRWFYGRFSAVFVRSEAYRESVRNLGVPGRAIHSLRPGIRTEDFHPRFSGTGAWERLGSAPGSVRVLYVGRVSVEKNLPLLVRAWKLVDADPRASRAELCVVGDGPYQREMREALRGCRARFVGFRHGEELSRLYAEGHLVVFPSATDTLGQVVMEAQASGVPVLVSDQGGPRSMVRDGETGLVLPARDAHAWARAILGMVLDGTRRLRMARAAHAHLQQYTMQRSFDHWWGVHEELAGTASGG